MRPTSLLLLLTCPALLCGCGSSPSSTPAPGSTRPPGSSALTVLAGDWAISGDAPADAPFTLPAPVTTFTGSLTSSGTAVTGSLRAYSPSQLGSTSRISCIPLSTTLAVTGTVDSSGNLTLTVPIANGTATITAPLPGDRHTRTPGSYTISGGDCAMPATPMHIVNFANATATYTGTLNQYSTTPAGLGFIVPGTATPVTVNLAEGTTPNPAGAFPVSGEVVATGACPAHFSIAPDTTISGGALVPPPGPPATNLFGAVMPDALSLFVGSFFSCPELQLQGTLTRQ